MAGPERFAVALAAARAALILGLLILHLGIQLPRPASPAMLLTGPIPTDAMDGALTAAVDQVALAIDGMT